jgi:hypothetical protein
LNINASQLYSWSVLKKKLAIKGGEIIFSSSQNTSTITGWHSCSTTAIAAFELWVMMNNKNKEIRRRSRFS